LQFMCNCLILVQSCHVASIWIISGASIWATSCWVQKINTDLMNRLCQKIFSYILPIGVLDTFHYVLEYCLQLDCIIVFVFNDAEVDPTSFV
jgi:hypothetical protein